MSAEGMTSERRLIAVWLVACALTLASALIVATTGDGPGANAALTFVVLGFGAAKVWLILEEFMEVRAGPTWLRLVANLWLVGLLVAIVVLYLQ
jgi:hypothetical protein